MLVITYRDTGRSGIAPLTYISGFNSSLSGIVGTGSVVTRLGLLGVGEVSQQVRCRAVLIVVGVTFVVVDRSVVF